ncbi:MAG: serine/threonine protein kinase [Deltaproteobacteria bacterium]|nr:serine/threonine protein kinase [Deltaproteobacteria bacterium]
MGSVWAARNELTNRDFAVKFLLPELSQNEDALNRFFLEARACGQIRHPAIVDVYDMGQAEDGSPYLVMELLEGEGFDQRIQRQGHMRVVDVCRYIALVARGLEEAHTRGLIHRDLKPGNIFFAIDKSGEVFPKVLDFGISKEVAPDDFDFVKTSTGTVLGSPAYMSPEQASGELDVDARTDIWALGVIMFEALTGELPFDANNYNALMLCIITSPHPSAIDLKPEVPLELSELIDQLLEKNRDDRIKSAGELASRLERIYARMTATPLAIPERTVTVTSTDGPTQHGWFKVRMTSGDGRLSPALWIGGALAVVGLAGGGFALASGGDHGADPATRVGALVEAMSTKAASECREAMSLEKAEQAEAAVQEAERRAAEAEKGRDERDEPETPTTTRPKTKGKDPHGGVDGPGF